MDWNEPLGIKPPQAPRRRVRLIVGASLAIASSLGLVMFLATADPHGGEPYGTAQIPAFVPRPVAALDPAPTASIPARDSHIPSAPAQSDIEDGVRVVRGGESLAAVPPSDAATKRPLVINVARALDEQDRRRHTSASVNGPASPVETPAQPPGQPQVAIFVSGMGLSKATTHAALEAMPAAVDLAFLPYGDMIASDVQGAAARGHEILLQLPMESAAGQRLGPHSLRAGEPAADVEADVDWMSARFKGYAGIVNLLGAPVTADAGVMRTVLRRIAGNGVFYLDDGTSPRSLAPATASQLGVPALTADVVLDATSDPRAIEMNLDRLVALARQRGHAIGMASGLPEHLTQIGRYAAALQDKGVRLVTVGELAGRSTNVAAAR